MVDVFVYLVVKGKLKKNLMKGYVVVVLVGILGENILCDLEYVEDLVVDIDMNVVMIENGKMIEI